MAGYVLCVGHVVDQAFDMFSYHETENQNFWFSILVCMLGKSDGGQKKSVLLDSICLEYVRIQQKKKRKKKGWTTEFHPTGSCKKKKRILYMNVSFT